MFDIYDIAELIQYVFYLLLPNDFVDSDYCFICLIFITIFWFFCKPLRKKWDNSWKQKLLEVLGEKKDGVVNDLSIIFTILYWYISVLAVLFLLMAGLFFIDCLFY